MVIFTDGFTPDQRKSESGLDSVGAVMFDRRSPFRGDPGGGLGSLAREEDADSAHRDDGPGAGDVP